MKIRISAFKPKLFVVSFLAMASLQALTDRSHGWGYGGGDAEEALKILATPGALQNALTNHPHGGMGDVESPSSAINSQGTPVGRETVPVGEGATPLADVGVDGTTGPDANNPYAALDKLESSSAADVQSHSPANRGPSLDPGAVDTSASAARQAARAAAMKNPKTAMLFQGDAAARQAAALTRFAAAIAGPAAGRLDASPAVRQQRQQRNNQWAAKASAGVAPQLGSLFDAAWWTAHQSVFAGSPSFYFPKESPDTWRRAATWDGLVAELGWNASTKAFVYDYGDNVSYEEDVIYVNGQPVCSYEDYVATGQTLANTPEPAAGAGVAWMPLGTFAISQSPDQAHTTMTVQLVVDKEGNLSGSYFNTATNDTQILQGGVDEKTQRAAFIIGANKTTVLETGLANLAEDHSQVWVHFPDGHSQVWLLARLTSP